MFLDAGPLGLLAFSKATPEALRCTKWLRGLVAAGTQILVPEVADFEVRRELLRLRHSAVVRRLDALLNDPGVALLPVTTASMRLAAEYWAQARQQGRPTADPRELDCDAIIAAQTRVFAGTNNDFVVATSNVRHLSLFVPAAEW